MGKPPLIMDMVWVIKNELVNHAFNYGVTPTAITPMKDKPRFRKQLKTKQPNVNSLNFVVDSLLHALQVVDVKPRPRKTTNRGGNVGECCNRIIVSQPWNK